MRDLYADTAGGQVYVPFRSVRACDSLFSCRLLKQMNDDFGQLLLLISTPTEAGSAPSHHSNSPFSIPFCHVIPSRTPRTVSCLSLL
jgi:hypothetical protein